MAATTKTPGRNRRLAALAVAGMAVLVLSGGSAHASSSAGDTGDHYSPASTSMTGTSSSIIFGTLVFVETCTSSRLSGTTPATGLGAFKVAPAFSDGARSPCTDGIGYTHTIRTSGTWKIRVIDAANDEASAEPNGGDTLQLTIPKNGLIDHDNIGTGCLIAIAPAGPVTMTGAYDDRSTLTFSLPSLPVAVTGGPGCPLLTLTTTSFTGTYTFSPGFSDAS